MTNKTIEIRELAQEERFDEALKLIAEVEKTEKLTPNLLVLKGALMIMSEKNYKPEDSAKAYEAALDIDDEYVEALNELGYFHIGCKNDAAEAKPLFEKAMDICESQMTESILGLAECILKTDGKKNALRFLQEIRNNPLDMERIEEMEEEIRSAKGA